MGPRYVGKPRLAKLSGSSKMRWLGSLARMAGMTPLAGSAGGQCSGGAPCERDADMALPGVEALELGVEILVTEVDQRPGEGFVEGVVAEDPRVAPERAGHVAPDPVVLALEIAPDVVPPEMGEGGAGGSGAVLERPAPGPVHAEEAVGAHGPVRVAFAVEHLVVHVLVHVQDRVDVEATQEGHGLPHPVDVAVEHRLVELMRIRRRPGAADGGVVGRSRPGLQPAPGDPEAHHVEAEPGHQ